MSLYPKCKCGHSKTAHDKQVKDGWCTGDWGKMEEPCDCDQYEPEIAKTRRAREI